MSVRLRFWVRLLLLKYRPKMESTSSTTTSFPSASASNTVYLETISSSSDFSDSSLDSVFPNTTIVEQRRKGILYCFLCQEISSDSCCKDNHLVFDVSDIIHCAIGSHVVLFYQTIKNLDSALDQRNKYGEVLTTVETSLCRLTTNVQEKIADNNHQISQLVATKNEIVSRRDNFLSVGASSLTDRQDFRSQIAECTKTVANSCASAAKIYQLYSNLQQSYLKVTIDGPYGNLSSVRVESSIDGPINILHVLDEDQYPEQYSTGDDTRRVVAYALETSLDMNERKNEPVRRIYPTKANNIMQKALLRRSPLPAPRTLICAPETLVQTPSLKIPFECRNKSPKLSKLSIKRLSTDDESTYITVTNDSTLQLKGNVSPPTPAQHTVETLKQTTTTNEKILKSKSPDVKTEFLTSSSLVFLPDSSQFSTDSYLNSTLSDNESSPISFRRSPPSFIFPVESKITGKIPNNEVLPFDLTPPDSPEFYEVPEGPNLNNPVFHSVNLEDAVLENRRFAADRIRNALKNTCVWHPQNNWLATTSDGPDALIWMLPLQNEIKNEKKIPNDSKRDNLSDSLRKQNRRVALDHSNDPVFQIAWNPNGTLLVTGSAKGVIRFWSTECNLDPSIPPEAEAMVETHENEVLVLKFNPSGKYLLSGGMDSKILAWDMDRLSLRQTFTCHSAPICDVDWKLNSNIFVSCAYNGCIYIHRVGHDNPLRSISDYPRWIKSVRWNPGADVLAACSVDSSLQIWKDALKISSEPLELNGHYRSVNAISWRPVSSGSSATAMKNDSVYNKYLASGSDDGTVVIWHVSSKAKMFLNSKNKSCVKCLCFSPNGKLLAAGREDGHLDCWFAKKGKLFGSIKLSSTIYTIGWDITGTQLAAAVGDFGIFLYFPPNLQAEYFEIAKLKKE